MNNPFRIKNAALLMALASIYPLHVQGATGIAQFAVGDVNVRRGAATTPLNRGQQIQSGDNIITGRAGQTQIRFSDGGLVSLAPNSQFNIDKYADDNKPEEDGFFASFLRGGMRAITGLVGKRNRDNYKITTTTATIGIRGSAFSANYNTDGSINVAGEQDGIVVCTNAGCVELIVGEAVNVTGSDSLPVRTTDRSNVPPLVARQDLFVPEGPTLIQLVTIPEPDQINEVLPGVSAMFASAADVLFDPYPRGGVAPSIGTGHFVGNQLYLHDNGGDTNGYGGISTYIATSGPVSSSGSIGIAADADFIGWGYWTKGQERQTYGGNSSLVGVHYLVGRPTPNAQMPTSGTATYSMVGGTAPTATSNGISIMGRLLDATMTVDFTMNSVDATINTEFQKNNVAIPVSIHDPNMFLSGAALVCGSNMRGFFTGNQATRAGLIYSKDNVADLGLVRGAVALQRGPIAPAVD